MSILKIQLIVGALLIVIALIQYSAYAFFGQDDFLKFEPTNESFLGDLIFLDWAVTKYSLFINFQ